MTRRIVISGCSGGGKSSLIDALSARGFPVFQEPGRQVVAAQLASNGLGLPWADAALFAKLVIARGMAQWQAAHGDICFYDRSLIDAVTWFERQTDTVPGDVCRLASSHRYDHTVFMAPPWPEIYRQDDARRHSFDDALAEYDALLESYPAKGYAVALLPKIDIVARAKWLIRRLDMKDAH